MSPIGVRLVRGRHVPSVHCCICGHEINEIRRGMFAWDMRSANTDDGAPASVFYVHKGSCWSGFKHANPVTLWGTMPVEVFPVYITSSIGSTPAQGKSLAEDLDL